MFEDENIFKGLMENFASKAPGEKRYVKQNIIINQSFCFSYLSFDMLQYQYRLLFWSLFYFSSSLLVLECNSISSCFDSKTM